MSVWLVSVEPTVRARALRYLATPRLHLRQACSSHHREASFKVCKIIRTDKINTQVGMECAGPTRCVGGADDPNVGSCDSMPEFEPPGERRCGGNVRHRTTVYNPFILL